MTFDPKGHIYAYILHGRRESLELRLDDERACTYTIMYVRTQVLSGKDYAEQLLSQEG